MSTHDPSTSVELSHVLPSSNGHSLLHGGGNGHSLLHGSGNGHSLLHGGSRANSLSLPPPHPSSFATVSGASSQFTFDSSHTTSRSVGDISCLQAHGARTGTGTQSLYNTRVRQTKPALSRVVSRSGNNSTHRDDDDHAASAPSGGATTKSDDAPPEPEPLSPPHRADEDEEETTVVMGRVGFFTRLKRVKMKMDPYVRVTLCPSQLCAQTSVIENGGCDVAWSHQILQLEYEGLFQTLHRHSIAFMNQHHANSHNNLNKAQPSPLLPHLPSYQQAISALEASSASHSPELLKRASRESPSILALPVTSLQHHHEPQLVGPVSYQRHRGDEKERDSHQQQQQQQHLTINTASQQNIIIPSSRRITITPSHQLISPNNILISNPITPATTTHTSSPLLHASSSPPQPPPPPPSPPSLPPPAPPSLPLLAISSNASTTSSTPLSRTPLITDPSPTNANRAKNPIYANQPDSASVLHSPTAPLRPTALYPSLLIEAFARNKRLRPSDAGPEGNWPDVLIGSATLDLIPFFQTPGQETKVMVNLTDPDTDLDDAGTVALVVSFNPNENASDSVSVPVFAPGVFHITVQAAKHLRDKTQKNTEDHYLAMWSFVVILIYLIAGIAFYTHNEGWTFLDSVYFCLVTLTTTGYGDLYPMNTGSKIFTIFFILIGVAMIATALGIVGSLVIEKQEQAMAKAIDAAKRGGASSKSRLLGYTARRMIFGLILFLSVLISGVIGFMLTEDYSVLDATYLSVVTLSSIGYGDKAPKTVAGRAFCCPWICVSTLIMTKILGDIVDMFMTAKRNRMAKHVLKTSIQNVDDLAALDDDNSGSVSELEFLKHMLVKIGACKQSDIERICDQFKALDTDGSGFLDADDFKKIGQSSSKLPTPKAQST